VNFTGIDFMYYPSSSNRILFSVSLLQLIIQLSTDNIMSDCCNYLYVSGGRLLISCLCTMAVVFHELGCCDSIVLVNMSLITVASRKAD